nr:hypothetical protein [Tanacetum cinerariifolium]
SSEKQEEKSIAELLAEKHAAEINSLFQDQNPSQFFISLDGDDDDDDYDMESIISTNTDIFEIPLSDAITTSLTVLPIEDLEDSLIMGNEELNTIPEKESNDFINSSVKDLVPIPSESEETSGIESVCILPSVKDLVPIPSESEETSGIESVCILPSCDDFSPIDVPEEKTVTFSNPLFNSNDDFSSSNDESLSDEDVLEDNVKKFSNPLFEFDDQYIFSDVNPLLMSYYDSEGDILYLAIFLNDDVVHHDPSIPKMSVASIIEGFIDEPPLEENDDLFDLEPKNDVWKKILYDAPILMTEDKNFDRRIHDYIFSPTYVSLPFEDRHYLFFTHVV